MKPSNSAIRGLYAVTPDLADTAQLCAMVEAALAGGARLVQYRNKLADQALARTQAEALLPLCRAAQVPLLINDHVALCLAIDADGVHIGADDGEIAATRQQLGSDKLLGVSCYNQLALAQQAHQLGADYVAFGACFSSGTKPAAVKADSALFQQASQNIPLPLVGIGGITVQNAAGIIQAGASAIAVIGGLWGPSHQYFAPATIAHNAAAYTQLFANPETPTLS